MKYVHMAKPSRYDLLRSSTNIYFVSYLFACRNVIAIFVHKQISLQKNESGVDFLGIDL